VVRRLGGALLEPVVVHGRALRLGASFGTAFARDAAESPDSVLRRADAAMYAAKRRRATGGRRPARRGPAAPAATPREGD
jgi:GGDEF domain-containing protein